MDERLKHLIKELGEAINQSLGESEQIGDVIAKIKAHGYDVFLVLEATIGFSRRDEDEAAVQPVVSRHTASTQDPDLKINAQDLKFLKSLRISLE